MFVTKSPGLYNEIICKPFILLGSQEFTCLMQDELYRFGFPFIKYNITFVSQPYQRKYLKCRSDGVTCNVTYSVKVSSQSRKSEFKVFSIVHLNNYNF